MSTILHDSKAGVVVCGLALSLFASSALAGNVKVIHNFSGGSGDGQGPFAGVTPLGKNFVVATDAGGSSNLGTITLVRSDGTSQVLHAFIGGSDGQNADGAPIKWSDGYLYGATQFGGASGCGTIYRYSPHSSAYQQVYAFKCAPDAAFPFAGLADTGQGFLLGTAYHGGSNDDGSLIEVVPGVFTGIACQFTGRDGSNPFAGVTTLNGETYYTVTTTGGTANLGAITSFDNSCSATVRHNFAGGSGDGATPYGSLLLYENVLYGTTSKGGGPGLGTVFKMNPDGSNFTVLYTFQGINQHTDGSFPHAGLTLNKADGMLYGTTINGGNSTDLGTVFKVDPKTGIEKVVHRFSGSDGAHPYGQLYAKNGALYGTTVQGGPSNDGVVFKLAPKT